MSGIEVSRREEERTTWGEKTLILSFGRFYFLRVGGLLVSEGGNLGSQRLGYSRDVVSGLRLRGNVLRHYGDL